MQVSNNPKKHNRVDYYPLSNGYTDVFLHRNEFEEADEEGNTQYVAEEIYFQIEQSVTKEQIERDFEHYWVHKGDVKFVMPTTDDRVDELENIILMLLGGEI